MPRPGLRQIDGIAINQSWQVPEGFWPIMLLFIAVLAVPETFLTLRGWMEPTVPENYFQLRPGYIPGDLDFDPAGLKPEDPEEFKEMQTKELQHCRLAMLAAAGMIVQELQTGSTLFYVSPSAPASADNILELKAQESIERGQVGWSQVQQSIRGSVALNAEMTKSKITKMVQELTKENFETIYEHEAWIVANCGSSIVKKTQRLLASKAGAFGLTVKPDFLADHKILKKHKEKREALFARKTG